MKALLQRVTQAEVRVDGLVVGAIGRGLLVLVCAEPSDTPETGRRLLAKLLKLRVFADEAGKMNRSLQDVAGGLLLVSQFTLAADTRGGTRPSFSAAAPPAQARSLWDALVADARELHPQVAFGVFAADMQVSLVNDGPVTLPLAVD
ncbi:D-aminoacyl-tRNA deacylase [Inhella crocodyli]|jgi:D-tyrosyl-tRNA(Tyr) deacylase|uniref:D-aminoacyl-tRNA deacylase n=1 Tax=Inhella crocodyli TaxID=2499851 RepID=A0A3S3T398_9BURK|nr:D-aminoacyl-tRNA deacylase [Inhella crocodyli]RVT82364.1 D-tyrosyl-tRNA(Tyr) deacylase [Inhella crocodyli]